MELRGSSVCHKYLTAAWNACCRVCSSHRLTITECGYRHPRGEVRRLGSCAAISWVHPIGLQVKDHHWQWACSLNTEGSSPYRRPWSRRRSMPMKSRNKDWKRKNKSTNSHARRCIPLFFQWGYENKTYKFNVGLILKSADNWLLLEKLIKCLFSCFVS